MTLAFDYSETKILLLKNADLTLMQIKLELFDLVFLENKTKRQALDFMLEKYGLD